MEKRESKNLTRTWRTKFETREEQDGKKIIAGYFAVCGVETELWQGAFEEIAVGAFDKTLGNDIRALTNHDTTLVLGRNKAKTLTLKADSHGLWGEVEINENDSDALNTYERVKRGDVDQCSFGFRILDEGTEWRDDGTVKWTLKEVDVYEVSICTFPAYEDTGIQARHSEVEQYRTKQLEQWRHKTIETLKGGKK